MIDPVFGSSVDIPCEYCGRSHEGNPRELRTLDQLDATEAIFFDRDVTEALAAVIDGMCGPRFRMQRDTLRAYFGNPAGPRFVILQWYPKEKAATGQREGRWRVMSEVDVQTRSDARAIQEDPHE